MGGRRRQKAKNRVYKVKRSEKGSALWDLNCSALQLRPDHKIIEWFELERV